VEKKAFKFKYRRALDKPEEYERRNKRMIEGQKSRFEQANVQQLIENYLREPTKYEKEYISFVKSEALAQYQDYFQTDKDEIETAVLEQSKATLSGIFENWQLPRQDDSTFKTFPLPKWNNELGFWSNAVGLISELSSAENNTSRIQANATLENLSQSSLVQKNQTKNTK
jgi:hypothetical protein